jgi:hypothetical protein
MGNICWLASYPKSGNTWLRAFLANLVADTGRPLPLAELSRYCEDEALPEDYSALAGEPSAQLSMEAISRLRPQVHQRIADRHPATVFVKTHNMFGSYDGYPMHNVDVTATAIYVVRNPLDVTVSLAKHFGLSVDEAIDYMGSDNAATLNDDLFVAQVLGSWSSHVESWTTHAGPNVLVLRYEDMLEKGTKTFGKVARLLRLDADKGRFERAIKHASFPVLAAMEREHGFVEASGKGARFFRKGRVNQWREDLSREQVARLVSQHREQMSRFKYMPAGF